MFVFLIVESAVLALVVLLFIIYWSRRHKIRRCRIPIGDYTLVQQIDHGGMADIYIAQHRNRKDTVAVKVLQKKFTSDKNSVHRFLMEGKNLNAIKKKFPNNPVVQVHDYGRESTTGRYIIIMEYLPGENLKNILLSKKSIDLNLKLHIIREVAKALQATHSLKIVHRDVSPENIIVQGKRVTLIDFGIAKHLYSDHQTGRGIVLGRLNYISPEQFKGGKATDKSDIYALGAVLFYLVEGKPLYDSKNPHEIMYMHLNSPVPAIKAKVPEELKKFIYRMLKKDPVYRPNAHEVVEKMRAFLQLGNTGEYSSVYRY